MPKSLREQIKSLAKRKIVPVVFGGVGLFLRRWNERERSELSIETEKSCGDTPDLWIRCKAIARSLCDEKGELIYDPADFAELAELDSAILNPVWDEVIKLQGGAPVDEAKKN